MKKIILIGIFALSIISAFFFINGLSDQSSQTITENDTQTIKTPDSIKALPTENSLSKNTEGIYSAAETVIQKDNSESFNQKKIDQTVQEIASKSDIINGIEQLNDQATQTKEKNMAIKARLAELEKKLQQRVQELSDKQN